MIMIMMMMMMDDTMSLLLHGFSEIVETRLGSFLESVGVAPSSPPLYPWCPIGIYEFGARGLLAPPLSWS